MSAFLDSVNLEVDLDRSQGWREGVSILTISNQYHPRITPIVGFLEMPSIAPRPSLLSLRKTLPPIFNLPSTSTGNNVPKSLHKTRRTWITNTHRIDQPVRVLECAHTDKYGRGVLKGIKMRARDVKSFDKAGGVEGALVGLFHVADIGSDAMVYLPSSPINYPDRQLSQSPNNFTPFGKQLRADLFTRLHGLRDPSAPSANSVFSLGMGTRR